MIRVETKSSKKFNHFWIMTVVNTIRRWSYKMQNWIFENTTTFRIPNIDVKVIPLINGRRMKNLVS